MTDEETIFLVRQFLTTKQQDDPLILKFIFSYIGCRNVNQASRDAGIMPWQGHGLIKRPEVYECIRSITEKALMKYGYDAEEIVERVKEMAGIDPIVFENADGSYKTHMSQIDPEARRAIKKFKVKNLYGQDANGMRTSIGQLIEVELYDKLQAIQFLGREKNVFKETRKVEHDVTVNMASVLLESRSRAEQRVLEQARPAEPIITEAEFKEITGKVDYE